MSSMSNRIRALREQQALNQKYETFVTEIDALLKPVAAELTDAKSGQVVQLRKSAEYTNSITHVGDLLGGHQAAAFELTAPHTGWSKFWRLGLGRRIVGEVIVAMDWERGADDKKKAGAKFVPIHVGVYTAKKNGAVMTYDAAGKTSDVIRADLKREFQRANVKQALSLN